MNKNPVFKMFAIVLRTKCGEVFCGDSIFTIFFFCYLGHIWFDGLIIIAQMIKYIEVLTYLYIFLRISYMYICLLYRQQTSNLRAEELH